MRWIRLLVICIFPLVLTGCWGAREIEHLAYVNTIGLDYNNGKVVFYVQLISFNNIAKKESGVGSNKQTISIGKGEGRTVDDAIFDLYKTAQQRILWSHVKTLVFTEAALRQDVIHGILDQMDRYYEFRYTIWTTVTRGPIENMLNTYPTQNMSTLYSQLNNPRDRYLQSSIIEPLYLYKFIWKWNERAETLLLPAYVVNKTSWSENKQPSPQLQQDGICALQSKQLKGCYKLDDILGLRWLDKETVRTPLLLGNDEKPSAMMVVQKIKPSIEPKLSDGQLIFNIKLKGQGSVTEMETPATEQELTELASKEVQKQIKNTYLEGLKHDADLLGFSNSLYRTNPKAWHQMEKDGRLPLTPESLGEIQVNIGLTDVGIAKIMKKQ